jgi:integration host factor subunit alpha
MFITSHNLLTKLQPEISLYQNSLIYTNFYLKEDTKTMTLIRSQIAKSIQEQLKVSTSKSSKLLESLLETIKQTLESGEDVMISNFGKFCVKEKKARKGHNPATGEDMMLPLRRVVTFKSSGTLRERINKG